MDGEKMKYRPSGTLSVSSFPTIGVYLGSEQSIAHRFRTIFEIGHGDRLEQRGINCAKLAAAHA